MLSRSSDSSDPRRATPVPAASTTEPRQRRSGDRLLPSEKTLAIVGCIGVFAVFCAAIPPPRIHRIIIGPRPDSREYVEAAQSLLKGRYVIYRDGVWRPPRYTPGFPILLAPVVAVGGFGWVPRLVYTYTLLLALLAALIAARLAGPLAAPLAAAGILSTDAMAHLSLYAMSDVPTAVIVVLELMLLAFGRGFLAHGGAGLLAGFLVWIRPASLFLVFAGLAAISVRRGWRKRAAWYCLGVAPLLVLLAAWQFAVFGSPLRTSYQAAHTGYVGREQGREDLGAFFSIDYVLGQPARRDGPSMGAAARRWNQPNGVTYPLQLLGADGFVVLPGVGLLGLVALLSFLRSKDPAGLFARFALVAILMTLVTYLPHGYQSARYMLVPGVLLSIAAAVLITRISRTAYGRVSGGRILRPATQPIR